MPLCGLPEVAVERRAKNDHAKGGDDVPHAPALADLLSVIARECDGLDLLFAGGGGEDGDRDHEDDDEHEKPALEDKPVRLPEPGSAGPQRSLHDSLARVRDDIGYQPQHADQEAADESPLARLRRDLLGEDAECEDSGHCRSQQRLDALQIAVEVPHVHHHRKPEKAEDHYDDGRHTPYKDVVGLTHPLSHGLIEVLGEECRAAVEECGEGSDQSADEAYGDEALDADRKDVLDHHGEGAVGVVLVRYVHGDAAARVIGEGNGYHAGNEEHEDREQLEVAGSYGAAPCALHDRGVVLAAGLPEDTLDDMLVGAPIPETDDRRAEEHGESGILVVHGIARVPMEHVRRPVSVMQAVAVGHHVGPAFRDAPMAEGGKAQEEHEERADDEDRRLDGRHGHHALHPSEHGEDGCNHNETKRPVPERKAEQILEKYAARKGRHAHLGEDIGDQRDDAQPRARTLRVTVFQKVGHRDDLAQLVAQKLIERHEKPAQDENHPALHLPMGHSNAVLRSRTG